MEVGVLPLIYRFQGKSSLYLPKKLVEMTIGSTESLIFAAVGRLYY
jgi:hypothetical protein